jgi:hypothetical protein
VAVIDLEQRDGGPRNDLQGVLGATIPQ